MAPKKDLTTLKAKEATMAAQATEKLKRPMTIPTETQELHWIKRGLRQDLVTMATRSAEVASTRAPIDAILAEIPLHDVLGRGLLGEGLADRRTPFETAFKRPFFQATISDMKGSRPML